MPLAAVVTVLAGFAGLAVLFALGWRLFQQVRSLAHTVGESSQRIAEASAPATNDEGSPTNVW